MSDYSEEYNDDHNDDHNEHDDEEPSSQEDWKVARQEQMDIVLMSLFLMERCYPSLFTVKNKEWINLIRDFYHQHGTYTNRQYKILIDIYDAVAQKHKKGKTK